MPLLSLYLRIYQVFSKILLTFSLMPAIIVRSFYYLFFSIMSLTKSLYATIATLFVAENALAAGAATVFDLNKAAWTNIGWQNGTAWDAISNIIKQLLTLVSIIAVLYVLWAGFQIMTAGGDEEKVKSGRKTIVYVVVGIVVMWLSFWLVSLVITSLT